MCGLDDHRRSTSVVHRRVRPLLPVVAVTSLRGSRVLRSATSSTARREGAALVRGALVIEEHDDLFSPLGGRDVTVEDGAKVVAMISRGKLVVIRKQPGSDGEMGITNVHVRRRREVPWR